MIQSWVSSQGAFNTPSRLVDAKMKSGNLNSRFLRPVSEKLCFPIEGYQLSVSTIAGLLLRCSPPNILWLVISIIVNTVNRVLDRWRIPNIFQKCLKGMPPLWTNSYSATTIAVISGILGISTSTYNLRPRTVFLRRLPISSMSMRGVLDPCRFGGAFPLQAPTASGIAMLEGSRCGNMFIAAITSTMPKLVFALNMRRSWCNS